MKLIKELEEELLYATQNGGAISRIKRDLANAKKEIEELEEELDFEPVPFSNTNSDGITIGYDVLKIDKNPDVDANDIKVDDIKVDDIKVDETKVDETKVDETKVDETKVDETKVDETEVDETKVDETKVDVALSVSIDETE